MHLNYISVVRGSYSKRDKYIIRGELDTKPSMAWFRYFQFIWISTPSYRKLCPEPILHKTSIILIIPKDSDVTFAVNALKDTLVRTGTSNSSSGNLSCLRTIYEALNYTQTYI